MLDNHLVIRSELRVYISRAETFQSSLQFNLFLKMSFKNLVAFIIGGGANVGAGVAATLKENGYKVAIGSRNPTATADGGYFPVQVDATKRESIVSAFDTITKALGPINVVIFNGV